MNKTLTQAISEEWGRQTLSAHIAGEEVYKCDR